MLLTVWLLATLTAYRLWRLVALDDLPLVAEGRDLLVDALPGRWADAITCSWCSGFWCCVATFALLDAATSVPLPVVQVAAASTVVGMMGAKLDG